MVKQIIREAKMSDEEVLSAAKSLAKNGKDPKTKEFGQGLVDFYKKEGSFTPAQVGGLQNIMKNASFQMAKESTIAIEESTAVKQIIKEAMDKNPLGLKEAVAEELQKRVTLALEAKMKKMKEEDDEDDTEDDEEDDMEDEEDDMEDDEEDDMEDDEDELEEVKKKSRVKK